MAGIFIPALIGWAGTGVRQVLRHLVLPVPALAQARLAQAVVQVVVHQRQPVRQQLAKICLVHILIN